MVFLRSVTATESTHMLRGGRVLLRAPQMSDHAAWADLREISRDFLTPWEPIWPSDDLSKSAFRRRIRRYLQDIRDDKAYPFFIFRHDDGALLGGITISNVRRGVAQSCSAGYWIGLPYARHGFMTDALEAGISFVFRQLRLHRMEAACLPRNEASIRLLKKCGFVEEGYACGYLRIGGVWEDHLLFALLATHQPRYIR